MEGLGNLNELASLQNQVNEVRLQDKLGKQNFRENIKKVFEPVTDTIKNSSEKLTKTITETSIKNNNAIEHINDKLLEIMNDRGITASYFLSPLSKTTNSESTSQFKLVKDSSSNRDKDLIIHNLIPVTLHDNLLTFLDINEKFEFKRDFLKMINNKNCNVDLASLADKKLMYEFAKQMYFDVKTPGKKSTRNRTLIKLNKSPGL